MVPKPVAAVQCNTNSLNTMAITINDFAGNRCHNVWCAKDILMKKIS
jgi:hypothetical protein